LDNARKAAYSALRDVESNKAYSNFAIQNAIKKYDLEQAAFVRELVYRTLQMQLYFDFIIGKFIKTPVHKLPVSDRILLRMGLCQLIFLDSVPDYAAVSETVELAKHYSRGREKFINGVLRHYIRDKEKIELPPREEDEAVFLSIKYSIAPWIIRMWMKEYERVVWIEHMLSAFNQKPRFCIRANTLKTEPEDLRGRLENLGYKVEPDEDLPDLFFIEGEGGLLGTDLFKDGLFAVQGKASRIAVESLGAQPGETIIHVCAAPGGKTIALAAAMKNTGAIIATDINRKKLGLIMGEAERLGVRNVTALCRDGGMVNDAMVNSADRVLVDAPCSGIGIASRRPEVKYKEYDEAMAALPKTQLDILSASAQYVKPGGILVYSTCTIAKRENMEVAEAFLHSNEEYELVDTIQLTPTVEKTDGFFVCKMKRAGGLA